MVALHLLLERLLQLVAGGLARDLQPGLAVEVRRALELVRHFAAQRFRRAGVGLPLQGGEQERARLHLDAGLQSRLRVVRVHEQAGGQERVGGAHAREGETPGHPGQPAQRDLALGVLQDLQLVRAGVAGLEREGRDGRKLHPAVEVAEAHLHQRLARHQLDAVVEDAVHGEADHVFEGNGRCALVEGGHAVRERKDGEDDPVHLAGDGAPELGLVHDAGVDERFPEPPLALAAQELGGLAELLVRDPAQGHQGLTQAVLLEVAGGEDDAAMVEEEGLDRLARLNLEVAAAARAGEGAERLRDGGGAEVGEHFVRPWIPQPHARCTPSWPDSVTPPTRNTGHTTDGNGKERERERERRGRRASRPQSKAAPRSGGDVRGGSQGGPRSGDRGGRKCPP